MLNITFKNLLKLKMLTICLIIGVVLSTAVVSAIPIYTKSLLNQFLDDIYTNAEKDSSIGKVTQSYMHPGMLWMKLTFPYNVRFNQMKPLYLNAKKDFDALSNEIPVPGLAQKAIVVFDRIQYKYIKNNEEYLSSYNEINSITYFYEHIDIASGRLPSDNLSENNELEVIIDAKTFEDFSLEIDKSYEVINIDKTMPLKLKVVGVYNIKSQDDPYWDDKDTNLYCRFIASENGIFNMFENNPDYSMYLKSVSLRSLFDYRKIDDSTAVKAYNTATEVVTNLRNRTQGQVVCTLTDNLKPYMEKQSLYIAVMWVLLIPVLLAVLYYVFMISGFIVDTDREQIAVLKSRGAGKYDLLRIYLYQGLVIGAMGLAAGPPLGFLICTLITRASGFMVFNAQSKTSILFDGSVYLYVLCAVIVLILTILTTVYFATKKSIVEIKQNRNRRIPSFIKFKNLDFVLLAISAYGYYLYGINKNVPMLSGAKSNNSPIDPLLYLVSIAFIVGAGMFLLRIYRYIVRLLLVLAKRINQPALYLSITNVLRDHLKKNTAMLFIAVTVALGIFNINVAKNINVSYENTVKYLAGADLIIRGNWPRKVDPVYNMPSEFDGSMLYHYTEPPFSAYSKVEGLEGYTRVLNTPSGGVTLSSGSTRNINTNILSIIPHEFGKIAWFDSSLLRYHWYHYLNAMNEKRDFVIISSGLSKTASIMKGDTIYYRIDRGLAVKGVVGEITDYWPGYGNLQNRNLIVSNFDYMFSRLSKYPYEVWIKKSPGIDDKTVYDSMAAAGIEITGFTSTSYDMYNAKKDIFLMGTNAILSLSFISVAAITVMGFIIYWVLSLRSRALQFGIYRSLGLSSRGVSRLLILEQILTLGSSVLIGVSVGILTGRLFLPIIKDLWYSGKYVIPVNSINYNNEYLQLGYILIAIFVLSLLILRKYISSLKIHQAIKLGED